MKNSIIKTINRRRKYWSDVYYQQGTSSVPLTTGTVYHKMILILVDVYIKYGKINIAWWAYHFRTFDKTPEMQDTYAILTKFDEKDLTSEYF